MCRIRGIRVKFDSEIMVETCICLSSAVRPQYVAVQVVFGAVRTLGAKWLLHIMKNKLILRSRLYIFFFEVLTKNMYL